MHRTESTNSIGGLYTDGPPPAVVRASELNSIQEELCYLIETLGITLQTAGTEDYTQLHAALTSLTFANALMSSFGLTATATEINTIADGCTATATEINQICDGLMIPHRSKFVYKDTDGIYIDPGIYVHHGTSSQVVYWHSQLTYTFTSLAIDTWSYLYLDDSAIVIAGTNVITVSELIDSVTPPTWSDTKHGWYNGNDRCIFAVLGDSGANILIFRTADNLVMFDEDLEIGFTSQDVDTTWIDVTLLAPSFSNRVLCHFHSTYVDGSSILCWRTNGSSSSDGFYTCICNVDNKNPVTITDGVIDVASKIEVKHTISNGNTSTVYSMGWYFPIGL